MLSYYSKLSSEVYNLDKPIGTSFGDIEYYTKRLADCSGRILEPAVGTGRMLVPLLEKGFKVDGFDISEEMLKICRKNCADRGFQPKLAQGEMESFTADEEYAAIIVPAGTFLLLHERAQSIKALENFRQHLKNGGRLIVDLYLQSTNHVGRASTRTWTLENGDVITLESKTVEMDFVRQFSVSHNRYEKWSGGELQGTELERFPMRWYGVEEFCMVLEAAGFTNVTVSADYEYGKYPTATGQSMTFEATAGK